ncbi:MAG TPA: hypothetical protein VFE47_14485 [Tepidisphaeraceae bacterium]|jgi:hypothetical protein|nr:hypothetical protein [Tepidisphaeraceae bacterium]
MSTLSHDPFTVQLSPYRDTPARDAADAPTVEDVHSATATSGMPDEMSPVAMAEYDAWIAETHSDMTAEELDAMYAEYLEDCRRNDAAATETA